jgi:hypothetical protein
MSFGIELGMLAAVRDCVDRDARREDACVERRYKRENMSLDGERENAKLTVSTVNASTCVLLHADAFLRRLVVDGDDGWREVEVRRGSETQLRVVSVTISPFGIGGDF